MCFRRKKQAPIIDPNQALRDKIEQQQEMNASIAKAEKKLKDIKLKSQKYLDQAVEAKKSGNEKLYRIALDSLKMSESSHASLTNILNVFNALRDKKDLNETIADLVNAFNGFMKPLANQSSLMDYSKAIEELNQSSKSISTETAFLNEVLNKMNQSMESAYEGDYSVSTTDLEKLVDERIKLDEAKLKADLDIQALEEKLKQ